MTEQIKDKVISYIEGTEPDPLSFSAAKRLNRIISDDDGTLNDSEFVQFLEAEVTELERQSAYYATEMIKYFYHPNVSASRSAEARLLREILSRI